MRKYNVNDGFGGEAAERFPSPVETLPQVRSTLPPAPGAGIVEEKEGHGFSCTEDGCGKGCKSPHGFARHLRKHGFGAIGRHFQK